MKKYIILVTVFFLGKMPGMPVNAQSLTLRVNQEGVDSIYRDEPVLFDISIINNAAAADERWNMAAQRAQEELRGKLDSGKIQREEYEREITRIKNSIRKINTITLGSPTNPWTGLVSWRITDSVITYDLKWPITLLKHPPIRAEAKLDATGYYSAVFGIAPEDWATIPPGLYAIEFSINNIYSNAVIVEVVGALLPVSISRSEDLLLRWGRYYWHAGDGAKVIQYAGQVLALDPNSIDGYSLKGDGQVLQQYYLPALESYTKALQLYQKKFGPDAEPPGYLMAMISWLKRDLGDPVINQ